ncbi:MAG TPA: hypothetical protein PLY34_14220 [Ferruginibacter sp.]|mgnify:FL=1|nr:hypothetical protein [Ferruginibacter sp.]HPH90600.1 hypothetical protein [Ferruginibacter sp.]
MAEIILKTVNRKTTITRAAVRKAVQAVFAAGSFKLKEEQPKKTIKKAARKSAA